MTLYVMRILQVTTEEGGCTQEYVGEKYNTYEDAAKEMSRRDVAEYGSSDNPYNTDRYITIEDEREHFESSRRRPEAQA